MRVDLYRVSLRGDTQRLRELARVNPKIHNGITPQGNSALHVAAIRGHREMVDLLIQLKPYLLLTKNSKDETPLHKAVAAGHVEVVNTFLNTDGQRQCSCGAHRNVDLERGSVFVPQVFWRSVNKDHETVLHYAARGGHVRVVENLLRRVNGIESIVNRVGESALYTACDHGRSGVAEWLLQAAFAADARTDDSTCLHVAIHTQQTELASLLLRQRPQLVKKADASGNMPLHLATLRGFSDLVGELLRIAPDSSFHINEDKMAPVHVAAKMGYTEIIESLINGTPQCVELLGRNEKNALHFSLEHCHSLETCRYLLHDRLDAAFLINEPDNNGNTAFHKTTFLKGLGMLNEMAKISKWNLNAVNKDGYTALDKLDTDGLLLLPPKGHVRFLENVVFVSPGVKFLQKRQIVQLPEAKGICSAEGRDRNETYSLIAMLLATVTFAAGFTVPSGVSDDQGISVWMHSFAFKAFIISNTLALSSSMVAIFLLLDISSLISASFKNKSQVFLTACNFIIWAFVVTMVSYVTGVYVLVAPRSLWLAVIVCIVGCSGPLTLLYFLNNYTRGWLYEHT